MSKHFSLPFWAAAAILLSTPQSRAQDEPAPKHHMENRFLFVIDTSSSMKARGNGVSEAVLGLLASDMRGELRKGDTIGLWTYSDRLNTEFPMQVWSEQKKDDIVEAVRDQLGRLHYAKRSHLEKALPAIGQAASHSERLTVILIFDGDGLIKGTHFDKDINELHKQYARQFKDAHQPFVTVLVAKDGAFFDYTINYPGTVVIPHTADPLPPPPAPPVTNSPPLVAVAPPPPPPPDEPERPRKQIILIGSNITHKASAPAPATVEVAPLAVTPAPVPVSASVPAVVTHAPSAVVSAPVAVPPATTNAPAPELAKSLPPPPLSAPPPPPAAPRAAPAVSEPAPVASEPAPTVSEPAPAAAKTADTTPELSAPATAAAVMPPAPGGQSTISFVIAFALLAVAVLLVAFAMRRAKAGQSLISQSINRSR